LPREVEREFFNGIDRELDYLNRLVGNLLDMSRLEAGTLTPHREWHVFDEVVEGALGRVEPLVASHPLEVSLPKNLPPIFVDGMQLQQVLVNLLDNAAKFSPPESPIGLAAALVGNELEVRVSNAGEGIPSNELHRVFDRFYRVQAPRLAPVPGTGLGLAICKGIVEAHGGSIAARSVQGAETAILFRIPAAGVARAAEPPAAARPVLPRAS
jgi:two-component system sensor histidine kinase KdpD